MSVKVTGLKELLGDLEKHLGKEKMQRVSDEGLKEGARVFVDKLKSEFRSVNWGDYSQGYTVEEITVSEPEWIQGKRTVRVYWKGPHDRYRIIHLNEMGTVKNPNPPAKGVIARSLRNSEDAYFKAIEEAVRRGI